MKKMVQLWLVTLLLVGAPVLQIFTPKQAYADEVACSLSSSPNTFSTNATGSVSFAIQNNGSNNIRWMKLSAPSANYSINSLSTPGWLHTLSANEVIIRSNVLASGATVNFSANVSTGGSPEQPRNWKLQVSEYSNGAAPVSCYPGSENSAQIVAPATSLTITSIGVSGVTATTAIVSWTTDKPAVGRIDFGTTSNYGISTSMESSFANSHQLTLTNLSPDTAYYFRVFSQDNTATTATSGNNTFLTGPAQATQPTSSSPAKTGGAVVVPTAANSTVRTDVPMAASKEAVSPTVVITSKIQGAQTSAPFITGEASDNVALAGIEYTIDGGKNWLPVPGAVLGEASLKFSFKPVLLLDGDYVIAVRVADTSGNQSVSAAVRVVIDLMPPQVGGGTITIGPQILNSGENQVLDGVVGAQYRVTLSAIGGPMRIALEAYDEHTTKEASATFQLSQSSDAGLWSGVLTFAKPGTYTIFARSLDGAGNTTNRSLYTFSIAAPLKVMDGDGKPIRNSASRLFVFNEEVNRWELWDGNAYGQVNPQRSNEDGELGYFIPAGRYYLEVEADGFRKMSSRIIKIKNAVALQQELKLKPAFPLPFIRSLFAMPFFSANTFELAEKSTADTNSNTNKRDRLVGMAFPAFNLPTSNGGVLNNVELRGEERVVTVLATWAPGTSNQLQAIDGLRRKGDERFVPLFSQERSDKVNNYLKTGRYKVTGIIDAHGELVDQVSIGELPTHYILDKHGAIKKVMVGVLSEEELIKNVVGR